MYIRFIIYTGHFYLIHLKVVEGLIFDEINLLFTLENRRRFLPIRRRFTRRKPAD